MTSDVKHPRTLAAFRAVLSLVTVLAVVVLIGFGLSVVGASVVLAGLSLLLIGDANVLAAVLLAVVGVLTTGGVAAGVVVAARRVDRRVTVWDRRPDPLDELRRAYIVGELDETTFERRVERLLDGGTAGGRTAGRFARLRGLLPSRGDGSSSQRGGRDPDFDLESDAT